MRDRRLRLRERALHARRRSARAGRSKIGLINAGLLPDVGEGINGSPGRRAGQLPRKAAKGPRSASLPDAGPGLRAQRRRQLLLRLDRRQVQRAADRLQRRQRQDRHACLPGRRRARVRHARRHHDEHVRARSPALLRALDVVAPDYQKGSQDFTAAWHANTGQFSPGFPAVNNDLSFITGETVGDVTGEAPKQEVLAGTASQDLQAYNVEGSAASTAWPKLTGGWIVATPVLGSLGTLDTSASAKKDVVSITREGTLSVYSTPGRAPARRARGRTSTTTSPTPATTRATRSRPACRRAPAVASRVLTWTAPGDDLHVRHGRLATRSSPRPTR